jgi:hypothetical protein
LNYLITIEIGLSSTLPCVGDVCSEDDMKQGIDGDNIDDDDDGDV